MKTQLTEYLMLHGILKGADATHMAKEIIEMLGVEKLTERNHELEQTELMRSASRPAEAKAMKDILEESKQLKAQLESVQKANAELREFALTHFSREQVMPLVEALHVIGHSNHNLECPNCPVCTAVEQALAHARAVGMEDKP